jgi:hypothetical protein
MCLTQGHRRLRGRRPAGWCRTSSLVHRGGNDWFRPVLAVHHEVGDGRLSTRRSRLFALPRRSAVGQGPTKTPFVCLSSNNRHCCLKLEQEPLGSQHPDPKSSVWPRRARPADRWGTNVYERSRRPEATFMAARSTLPTRWRHVDRGEAVPKVVRAYIGEPGSRADVAKIAESSPTDPIMKRGFVAVEPADLWWPPKRRPYRRSHRISHRISRYAVGCTGMVGRHTGHEMSDFSNGAIQKPTGRDGRQRITKPLRCQGGCCARFGRRQSTLRLGARK